MEKHTGKTLLTEREGTESTITMNVVMQRTGTLRQSLQESQPSSLFFLSSLWECKWSIERALMKTWTRLYRSPSAYSNSTNATVSILNQSSRRDTRLQRWRVSLKNVGAPYNNNCNNNNNSNKKKKEKNKNKMRMKQVNWNIVK